MCLNFFLYTVKSNLTQMTLGDCEEDRMQTIYVGFLKDKVWFAEQSRKHSELMVPSTEADKTKTKFFCSLDPFLFCGKDPHYTPLSPI